MIARTLFRHRKATGIALVLLVLATVTPIVIRAFWTGPYYDYTNSYSIYSLYEDFPCSGDGISHDSEVKFDHQSSPHEFQAQRVRNWGRITTKFGAGDIPQVRHWRTEEILYHKWNGSSWVWVGELESPLAWKTGGATCDTPADPQDYTTYFLMPGGAWVSTKIKAEYSVGGAAASPEYSTNWHFLQDP